MSDTIVNAIPQFNFQVNRVLTYGDLACNCESIKTHIREVRTLEEWYTAWSDMAQGAEGKEHYLHAAYYYRMAEFFLKAYPVTTFRELQISLRRMCCFWQERRIIIFRSINFTD